MTSLSQDASRFFQLAVSLYDTNPEDVAQLAETAVLPPLTPPLLSTLIADADKLALSQPRQSWTITAVAHAAARQQGEPLLEARTAWEMGRAANAWLRPRLAKTALNHAQTLFTALNKPDWVAACIWQWYVHPWMHDHFPTAVVQLEDALNMLQQHHCADFIPSCRLSLALGYILVSELEKAQAQLEAVENSPAFQESLLLQGHFLIIKSSFLRRQNSADQLLQTLTQAFDLFNQVQAPVYKALAHYLRAFFRLNFEDDFPQAASDFKAAMAGFSAADTSTYYAQACNGLAQLHTRLGQLGEARPLLLQAREIYDEVGITGLLADNLLDNGRLASDRGQFQESLTYFQRAKTLYETTGKPVAQAVATMNEGELYVENGRYQQGLKLLEQAHQEFQTHQRSQREAECQMRLAQAWIKIGNYPVARRYLDQLIQFYGSTNQAHSQAETYHLLGALLFANHDFATALAALEQGEQLLDAQTASPAHIRIQRLLGEIYCRQGDLSQAKDHLTQADSFVAKTSLKAELAACQLAWGRYQLACGEAASAKTTFLTIVQTHREILDIYWQTLAELGQLAEGEDDRTAAFHYYDELCQVISTIRHGLWQPSLADTLLQKPIKILEKALRLAVHVAHPIQILPFIEESKAQTMIYQRMLSPKSDLAAMPPELADLRAEIRWLQEKLQSSSGASFIHAALDSQALLVQQLTQKRAAYQTLFNQWRRQSHDLSDETIDSFSLKQFRQAATKQFGENWLALDFYLTEQKLLCIVLTPSSCTLHEKPYPPLIKHALYSCSQIHKDPFALDDGLLQLLGSWLFPPELEQQLSQSVGQSNTHLIISPSRSLHQIPWSAISLADDKPLVAHCIPLVTSSLQNLRMLWQPTQADAKQETGFVMGLSSFAEDRHRPLPFVEKELESFSEKLGEHDNVIWRNGDVTWSRLKTAVNHQSLKQFAFWHVATHAWVDLQTGHFSHLALYDDDILVDQLWELAPLPDLVVLSACNGSQSLMYEGDESVGLAATCLVTGAKNVVGSLWPVFDEAASNLTTQFYDALFTGMTPAKALATAQRTLWAAGQAANSWGGLLCLSG
ncbi:MAG: CHAT domain-containing protein [Chloroflexota bacterium]